MRLGYCWLWMLIVVPGIGWAQEWDPEDTTFDPELRSVVIGDRTWLGDPSPFVYTALPRTGYTYVAATKFEGYPPSVQISLMVPMKPGETQPVGGMLMMNEEQTRKVLEHLEAALKQAALLSDGVDKASKFEVTIPTAMTQFEWTLTTPVVDGEPRVQLTSKMDDKAATYQFKVNATKKLMGAVKYALSQLGDDSRPQ